MLPRVTVPSRLWKYLRISMRQANRSPHAQYRHGSCVVKGGAIVSSGHNHNSIHAEVTALNKSNCDLRGAVVWSVRVTKSGHNLAEAKPCINCQNALRAAGVKTVYYSTSLRTIEIMRL